MKTALILFFFLTQAAYAIQEENFAQVYDQEVKPYFAQGQRRIFKNPQGLGLVYYTFFRPRHSKTLVIVPGRTEPALKYAELAYDLRNEGFNLYILDLQGQGESERLLNKTEKGHVIFFNQYAQDLKYWLKKIVVPETKNQERYLFSHSMGGAISAYYLAYNKGVFKKALFSSPMMRINTAPYSESFARILAGTLTFKGFGSFFAPGKHPYNPTEDTFEDNEVTHSLPRFNASKALFVNRPALSLGGPTNRWVHEALKATKSIQFLASKIEIPILMNQAEEDTIVMNDRGTKFCGRHSNCTLVNYANAHHEIFMEQDLLRDEAIRQMLEFFK